MRRNIKFVGVQTGHGKTIPTLNEVAMGKNDKT